MTKFDPVFVADYELARSTLTSVLLLQRAEDPDAVAELMSQTMTGFGSDAFRLSRFLTMMLSISVSKLAPMLNDETASMLSGWLLEESVSHD